MTINKLHLGIYTRVSTKLQANEGQSLDVQREMGIECAKSHGWQYTIFEDAGISASSEDVAKRAGLQSLISSIVAGDIDKVYTVDIDRLSRNEMVYAYLSKTFRENEIEVITDKGSYNLNDANDQLLSGIQSLFAVQENIKRTQRIKRGIEKSAQLGKWHGGILPYGFDKDDNGKLIINSEESKVYQLMVNLSLQNFGGTRIARVLNEKGIPTKGQKIYKNGFYRYNPILKKTVHTPNDQIKWVNKTILGILKNPLYKGEMTFKGHTHQVPSHISKEKWDSLQHNLINNRIHNQRNNKKHFYLLKNLLVCKKCSKRMVGLIKPSRGMRLYQCISKKPNPEPRHCGLKNINLDKLNTIVWTDLMNTLTNPEIISIELQKYIERKYSNTLKMRIAINEFQKKIEMKTIEKSKILDLYGKTEAFSMDELEKKVAGINSYIKNTDHSLKKLQNGLSIYTNTEEAHKRLKSYLEMYNKHLAEITNEQKVLICRQFIERIVVDWEEGSGHTIQIQYRLPLPKFHSFSPEASRSTIHKEFDMSEESSFIVSKVLEKV
jgi:site-specific DNA recombinase